MSEPALTSIVDAWLRARPEWALAMPYLHDGERERLIALACLEQQWIESVYGISETDVAVAKLSWWLQELDAARRGSAQHPLTKALFADPRALAIDAASWAAPIEAGLRLRDAPPCADFAAQLALTQSFHGPLAALETTLWFGHKACSERAAQSASLAHLLDVLGRVQQPVYAGAQALPMNLLARHGLNAHDLVMGNAGCAAACHDQLNSIAKAWQVADQLDAPISVLRALSERADRAQLRRARRATDPQARLAVGVPAAGLSAAFAAWRAARRWRGWINDQTDPT